MEEAIFRKEVGWDVVARTEIGTEKKGKPLLV